MPEKHKKAKKIKRKRNPYLKLSAALLTVAVLFAAYIVYVNSLVKRSITIEAGSLLPDADEFARSERDTGEYLTDTSAIDTTVPGQYDIRIRVRGRELYVVLKIVDTTAPAAEPADCTLWLGETADASSFAANASDITPVSYSFQTEPDFSKTGTQPVTVLVKDTSGNSLELHASLTIRKDEEEPVISGVTDLSIYLGESVAYKKNVTVTDNRDTGLSVEVDNSAVNPGAVGVYEIVYSATDSSGNRAEARATLTIKEKPANYISEEQLYAVVDDVLADILKPGMTDLEKISEIFYWIAGHIDYVGTSDKSDWVRGAYLGMTRGTGDCFNYYAAARAMLTRAGYECIPLERIPTAKTHHYWNLVKYNGQYYHFDPLPNLAHYHYVCLLRTDAEVAEFSATKTNFYVYDKTGIPASATVPLDIERKVIMG